MTVKGVRRLDGLEGTRFLSCLVVAFGHGIPLYYPYAPEWRPAIQMCMEAAMSWFFVLSGFVIHYNYRDARARGLGARQFLVARMARIYPLYFLIVIIPMAIWLSQQGSTGPSWWGVLLFALTAQTWWAFKNGNDTLLSNQYEPISTHLGWSISAETFFYFIYALCLKFKFEHRVFQPKVVLGIYAVTVVLCMVFYYVPSVAHTIESKDALGVGVPWLFYYSPYLHVSEFMLGALAAHYYLEKQDQPADVRLGVKLTASIWAGYALTYATIIHFMPFVHWHLPVLAPFVASLIFVTARYPTRYARFLGSRLMVACATTTYGIYLTHGDVLRYVEAQTDMSRPERMIVSLLLLVFVCAILYRFYEKPSRDWIRRRFSGPKRIA